jgi:hypothetical protein
MSLLCSTMGEACSFGNQVLVHHHPDGDRNVDWNLS